jgi:hypothetical protein
MSVSQNPLQWPTLQPRTPAHKREQSRFQVDGIGQSRKELLAELERLGARGIVISSNLELRRDGLPYADSREPADPGVAVYFERGKRPFVIACDSYLKAAHNLRAIAKTVEALRTIERHGSSRMLEQAFTGFAALPAAGAPKPWWEVLGVPEDARPDEVRFAYLELVRVHHPDTGGSTERMAEINAAFEEAKAATR